MALTLRPANPLFVAAISNLDESSEILGRTDRRRMSSLGNRQGHTDYTFKQWAGKYSFPRAIRVTGSDGETRFIDMRAAHAMRIEGMEIPESRILRRDLMEHAVQPRLIHTHRWRPGDMVMWDNRRTLQRACADHPAETRELRRTTVMEAVNSLRDAIAA